MMAENISFVDDDLVPELDEISGLIKDTLIELTKFPDFVKNNNNATIDNKMNSTIALVNELIDILRDVDLVVQHRSQELIATNGFSKYDLSIYENVVTINEISGFPLARTERLVAILDHASSIAFKITTLNLFTQKLEIDSKKINNYVSSIEFTFLSTMTKMYEELQIIARDIKNVNLSKIIETLKPKISTSTLTSTSTKTKTKSNSTSSPYFSERRNNGKRIHDITEFDSYHGSCSL